MTPSEAIEKFGSIFNEDAMDFAFDINSDEGTDNTEKGNVNELTEGVSAIETAIEDVLHVSEDYVSKPMKRSVENN